jgi:hypothetical protein
LDYLEAGQSVSEFLDDFPAVTRQAAVQALEHTTANPSRSGNYAARKQAHDILVTPAAYRFGGNFPQFQKQAS